MFELNKQIFTILGVWPVQSTYGRFSIWSIYVLIHLSSQLADLVEHVGDFEGIVLNLTETTLSIMICFKMGVMRFSETLVALMTRIIDGIDLKAFESPEELKTYLGYNRIAKTFFKFWLLMAAVTEGGYILRAFAPRLVSGNNCIH